MTDLAWGVKEPLENHNMWPFQGFKMVPMISSLP